MKMKSLFLVLITVLMINTSLKSQHCPFDGAYIIVLHVHAENDMEVIPNLKISLVDSSGNAVISLVLVSGVRVADTLIFWQNPEKTKYKYLADNINPTGPWTLRFWFAENNYVLVTSRIHAGDKIKIEDIDMEDNGGLFASTTMDLSRDYIYPLCTNNNHWDKGEDHGFVKNYAPILIKLTKI